MELCSLHYIFGGFLIVFQMLADSRFMKFGVGFENVQLWYTQCVSMKKKKSHIGQKVLSNEYNVVIFPKQPQRQIAEFQLIIIIMFIYNVF